MEIRVRMYRQGLGDCFLLTFGTGADARHVLIDCGTLGATTTGVDMTDVAQDIHDTTGGHLDLLVATHEHKDHLSGFLTEQEIFDQVEAERVWLAWTENADDELAKEIAKYKGDLVEAATLAAKALESVVAPAPERKALAAVGAGIRKLLEFGGEVALSDGIARTVNDAMNYVMRKGKEPVTFLDPGGPAIEPDWLPGVRFYVLGPPRDAEALANLGEHGSPELYELVARQASDFASSARFCATGKPFADYYEALDADERQEMSRVLPFDARFRLESRDDTSGALFATYHAAGEEWRRIDSDWLTGAADFALQLDGQTNNTSLALAVERIADGKVLLLPADAQVGNWMSWHDEAMKWTVKDAAGVEREVTATDLLRRAVFYKVGHHSSHNATMREHGLELMASSDLVAMIPVDRVVALKKKPPWLMPARELFRRLIEKAGGRVVRSDLGWASADDPDFGDLFTEAEWAAWKQAQDAAAVTIGELFVEWVLAE